VGRSGAVEATVKDGALVGAETHESVEVDEEGKTEDQKEKRRGLLRKYDESKVMRETSDSLAEMDCTGVGLSKWLDVVGGYREPLKRAQSCTSVLNISGRGRWEFGQTIHPVLK